MHDLTDLIDRWKNGSLELRKVETLINLLIVDNERMELENEKFEKINQWCDAYPLGIFPEPDFKMERRTNTRQNRSGSSTRSVEVQRLVKCPVCGDTHPMKTTSNGAFYKSDTPVRHASWKYDKRRGIRKTWCPGGGI